MGIVIVLFVGKVGVVGQVISVFYDDFVDLEYSVDLIYCVNLKVGWFMYDQIIKVVCKIKDMIGCLIFVFGYEQGNLGGVLDCLFNCLLIVDQVMLIMVVNVKLIVFGDYLKYMICEVMDLIMFCMVDFKYIEYGQIGFVVFNCQGGNLVDGGGVVKIF